VVVGTLRNTNNGAKYVVPSEDLVHLAKNCYISDEERRYRRLLLATYIGIIVAFIVGYFKK
jgi:hypothetical protein